MDTLIWWGIVFCISQSAMFSGLNLAIFSVSRLRLEVATSGGSPEAARVLELRRDSNFALTTILWGNISVNVLLALLSDSLLTGVGAFIFSTFIITMIGEIFPQAYFSRHAITMASRLKPFLRFYQFLLYPLAKPTALLLDRMLGPESISYFRERDFHSLIIKHIESGEGDVSRVEGVGALNFLDIDDIAVADEGEPVDPLSIIELPLEKGRPQLPSFQRTPEDPFLKKLNASGKKWVIIIDDSGTPRLVLDADHFLRDALFGDAPFSPDSYWHRPITITDSRMHLGDVIGRLKVHPQTAEDDVVDNDLILFWGAQKRIITGADLLGRLLRGITTREPKKTGPLA